MISNRITAYASSGRSGSEVEVSHRTVQRTGGKGVHDVASGKVDTMDR